MASDVHVARFGTLSDVPLLSGGFRLFFLLGALWAIVVPGLFITALAGKPVLPAGIDPIAWHRHEMLFGYLGAVVGGFLLTAIPNWTGRPPLKGAALLALASLWLAGRLAVILSGAIGIAGAVLLDAGFLLVMAAIAGAELYAARNRNVPVVVLTAVLAIASMLDLIEGAGAIPPSGLGYRIGVGAILTMVMLIGGRLIPTFTRNWLVNRGVEPRLPPAMQRFDLAVLVAGGLAMLAWIGAPSARPTGIALVAAGLLNLARLLRWRGWRTGAEPLVMILHLAYLWVPVGLVLLGASILGAAIPASAGLHALTAGAFGGMTLAVMTRASLGHTGRPLHAGPATCAIYVMIMTAVLLRVAAPVLPIDYMRSIHAAAAAWIAAFGLFILFYAPVLFRPRAHGRV